MPAWAAPTMVASVLRLARRPVWLGFWPRNEQRSRVSLTCHYLRIPLHLFAFCCIEAKYARAPEKRLSALISGRFLVLPDRIELSTSPLPRECSTTELRQHGARAAARPKRAETATRGGRVQGKSPACFAGAARGGHLPLPPPLGLASPRLFAPNHWHDPSALRGGPGAARSGAAGESRAAQGSKRASARQDDAPAQAQLGPTEGTGEPDRGVGERDPRFRRICRGQAVKVNGSGVRPRPVRLRRRAGAR